MTASTRTAAVLGSTLVLLGTGACAAGDDRAIPTMVVAWPPDSAAEESSAPAEQHPQEPTTNDPATADAATPWRAGDARTVALSDVIDVEALDAARTDTVEDREALRALLEAAAIDEVGAQTVTIESGQDVALVVELAQVAPALAGDAWPESVEERGALLLATIADLDEVVFQRPGPDDARIDREWADSLVDRPVDELGSTPEGLRALVAALEE